MYTRIHYVIMHILVLRNGGAVVIDSSLCAGRVVDQHDTDQHVDALRQLNTYSFVHVCAYVCVCVCTYMAYICASVCVYMHLMDEDDHDDVIDSLRNLERYVIRHVYLYVRVGVGGCVCGCVYTLTVVCWVYVHM
jgi:hypothetical protein